MAIKGTSGAVDGVRDHYGIKASHWTERVHSDRRVGELKWQEGIVGAGEIRRFGCWQDYVGSFLSSYVGLSATSCFESVQ